MVAAVGCSNIEVLHGGDGEGQKGGDRGNMSRQAGEREMSLL